MKWQEFVKWEINWKRLLFMIGIILVIVLLLLWISLQPASPDWKKLLPVVGIIFIAILLLVWIKRKCPEKVDIWKGPLFLICCILVTLLFLTWINWKPAHQSAKQAKQMSELLTIEQALEEYHQKYLEYPQSYEMPSTIGEFLPEVPRDSQGKPYGWMDNTDDPQKFCVWAELELERNLYFLASPCGEKQVQIGRLPVDLDECCELFKP